MIRTCASTTCRILLAGLLLVTTTSAQQQTNYLQRIVKRTTVAVNMTGSANDIIVGHFGNGPNDIITGGSTGVTLLPNIGTSPVPQERIVSTGTVESLCVGKLNGDALSDFVYAMDGGASAISVGLQNGVGSFALHNVLPSSNLVLSSMTLARAIGRSVKAEDMDGDGLEDIVATINGADGDARKGALLYMRNTGDGINYDTSYLDESIGGVGLVQIMDLDGDSRLDIVVMGVDSKKLTVYFNEAVGSPTNFTRVVLDEAATSNLCIATGDFNNAGQGDILAIGKTSIHFYLNYYQRNFQKWDMFNYGANETGSSSDYHHFSCALNDMDGNGLTDIVYTQGLQNVSTILTVCGLHHCLHWKVQDNSLVLLFFTHVALFVPQGVFFIPQTKASPSTFSGPGRVAAAAPQTSQFQLHDINGDGIKDIVLFSQGDQAVYSFLVQELNKNQFCMI
jgi:hypothetical protein